MGSTLTSIITPWEGCTRIVDSSLDTLHGFAAWRPVTDGTGRWLILIAIGAFGLAAPLGGGLIPLVLFLLMLPLLYREANPRVDGRLAILGSLGSPTMVFVAVTYVSALLSDDIRTGLAHALSWTIMAVIGLLGGRMFAREREFFHKFGMPLALTATVVSAAYAVYQYGLLEVQRATAFMDHTNRLATLLVFFGIWGVGYLLDKPGRLPWLALPFGVVTVAGLNATMSRGGWIAAAVGLAIFALRGQRRFLAVFLIAITVFGIFIVMDDDWLARFQTSYRVDANQDRIVLWEAATKIAADYPMLGAGPGSFLRLGGEYIAPKRYVPHATPHNIVLSIVADTGLIGILAFLWLMGKAGVAARFLWRHGNAFYVGLVAAVGSIFANDLFGQGFYTMQIGTVMWFGLGLLAAFSEMERERIEGQQWEQET